MAERQTPPPRRGDNSGERRQSTPVRSSGERRPASSRDYDRDRRQPAPVRGGSAGRSASASARSGGGERRQSSPRRNDVIRCDNCGEDYSTTYRRCPFCDERPGRGGIAGKRVANTRGGGYGRPVNPIQIAGLVVSLILIISALFIVVRFIGAPIFGGDKSSVSSSQGSGSGAVSGVVGSGSNPQYQAVQSITLNNSSFNLNKGDTFQMVANLLPAGVTGEVIWASSDVTVATVDANGLVTNTNAGSTDVKVTITATCGSVSAEAAVYCKAASGSQGKVVNAKNGLRVRSGPGTTYDKIDNIKNGTQVTILSEDNGWYKITYSGNKTGYVSKTYISVG